MISDELYTRLKEWLADATSTSPSWGVKQTGLCSYMDNTDLVWEMKAFWEEQGLDPVFPFNSIVFYKDGYFEESDKAVCHLNPRRLAWVRERIAEYDHTLAMYEEAKRT